MITRSLKHKRPTIQFYIVMSGQFRRFAYEAGHTNNGSREFAIWKEGVWSEWKWVVVVLPVQVGIQVQPSLAATWFGCSGSQAACWSANQNHPNCLVQQEKQPSKEVVPMKSQAGSSRNSQPENSWKLCLAVVWEARFVIICCKTGKRIKFIWIKTIWSVWIW